MSFLKDKSAKGATDILKVIVVFALPFVHANGIITMSGFCTESLSNTAAFFAALLIFGGPVFLICFGIDMYENRSYQSIIKLGVEISLINIVFNIIRAGIPDTILIFGGLLSPSSWIIDLAIGDIYAFIGLFCIAYGFARKHKWSLGTCTAVSCGMFALNLFLENHVIEVNEVLSYYIGNFVSGYAGSSFSLLGWSIFPCIGMYLFKAMKQEKAKRDRTFGFLFIGTIAAFAVFLIILRALNTNIFQLTSDFFFKKIYGLLQGILMLLAGLFLISLMYFVYGLIPENKIEKKVIMLSNLVMPFYLIHFIILCLLLCGTEFALMAAGREIIRFGVGGFFAFSIGITVVTAYICYKKGFTFTRWLFKAFDYQRWFRKKKVSA